MVNFDRHSLSANPTSSQARSTLKAALSFHRTGWDAGETERVRKIIEEAAAAISKGSGHE